MCRGNILTLFILIIASSSFVASWSILQDDPICVNDPPSEVIPHPHEANCSLYWECFNGEKTLNSCSDGFWYNPVIQTCDFPESSGCTNPTTTTTEATSPDDCKGVDLDYLPYPADCSKYIECYEGNGYLMNCPPGYYFSMSHKRCVLPEDADCGTTTSPTWTTPNPVCYGVHPGEIVLKPYPGDCRKYYECQGADLSVLSCPRGLYFNEKTQSCDFPGLVDCDDRTTTEPPSSSSTGSTSSTSTDTPGTDDPRCAEEDLSYWPVPYTCTQYIECYLGATYLMDCPSGLYFDDSTKKCLDPSESDCGKTTVTPTETTSRPTNWTPDPDCPWPSSGDDYLFPYEGDCTKFWECDEGIKVVRNCPEGLYFNPELLICDYPYEAGCEWAKLFQKQK